MMTSCPYHEPWQEEIAKRYGFGMTCSCGAVVSTNLPPEPPPSPEYFEELLKRLRGKLGPNKVLVITTTQEVGWMQKAFEELIEGQA